MTYARSVFIIHNIAHQGRGPLAELSGLEVSRRSPNTHSGTTLLNRMCYHSLFAVGPWLRQEVCNRIQLNCFAQDQKALVSTIALGKD